MRIVCATAGLFQQWHTHFVAGSKPAFLHSEFNLNFAAGSSACANFIGIADFFGNHASMS
jgi:hypothetical protein